MLNPIYSDRFTILDTIFLNDPKIIGKQKKEFSYNKLLAYCRLSDTKYQTMQSRTILVLSGVLNGYLFLPNGRYTRIWKVGVPYSWDICSNYNLVRLFKKMYEHNLITLDQFTTLIE